MDKQFDLSKFTKLATICGTGLVTLVIVRSMADCVKYIVEKCIGEE